MTYKILKLDSRKKTALEALDRGIRDTQQHLRNLKRMKYLLQKNPKKFYKEQEKKDLIRSIKLRQIMESILIKK